MSSDSEEDCYGNIAQRLQSMKNMYKEDKIESTNLLNDSTTDDCIELDEIVNKAKLEAKTKKSPVKKNVSERLSGSDDIVDESSENVLRRVTRASARKASNNEVASPETANETVRRGRGRGKTQRDTQTSENQSNTPQRGRAKRGRHSRGSNRGRRRRGNMFSWLPASTQVNPMYPIYSIGNTDEYPDQSDSQTLFSGAKSNNVILVEDNDPLENEELSVKVYWQSSEFFKFTVRKYQKLTQIFDYFSSKEKVSHDKLFFTYNDKILKANDTPDSIGYNIVKFIDGGIVNQSVINLVTNDEGSTKDGIQIKFQCENMKKPFVTSIKWDDKLSIAMFKCAEHLEIPLDKIKFQFDGDIVTGKNSARELDFEGGECIDVKIFS